MTVTGLLTGFAILLSRGQCDPIIVVRVHHLTWTIVFILRGWNQRMEERMTRNDAVQEGFLTLVSFTSFLGPGFERWTTSLTYSLTLIFLFSHSAKGRTGTVCQVCVPFAASSLPSTRTRESRFGGTRSNSPFWRTLNFTPTLPHSPVYKVQNDKTPRRLLNAVPKGPRVVCLTVYCIKVTFDSRVMGLGEAT